MEDFFRFAVSVFIALLAALPVSLGFGMVCVDLKTTTDASADPITIFDPT